MGFFGKKDKKEKKAEKKMMSTGDGKFRCPYCFEQVSPEDVAFRAKTSYKAADLASLPDNGVRKRKELYQEPKKDEVADSVYEAFWKRYNGSKPEDNVGDDESKRTFEKHAVLARSGTGCLTDVKFKEVDKQSPELVFKRDVDGFLNEVIDTEGVSSKIRICPCCHNRLPFEFGKYPIKYIAVVGITSSGKTIYLSRLLADLEEILDRAGMAVAGLCPELNAFVRGHRIRQGKDLPNSTLKDLLTPPIPVNVKTQNGEMVTLVFYDIAGENCVEPDRMEAYGAFIRNADGIIMIIDPNQFTDLIDFDDEDDNEEGEKEEKYSPGRVLDAMHDAFGSAEFAGGKVSIPIAVSISKSDQMREKKVLEEYSNVFQDIPYDDYKQGGFPEDEWKNVHGELEILLAGRSRGKGRVLDNKLRQFFPVYGYFAFSALSGEPLRREDGRNKWMEMLMPPRRVEEPLLWLLYQLGLIDKAEKRAKNR